MVKTILPVVAAIGNTAVICVALFTAKLVAGTPLKVTEVTPVKLVPVIITVGVGSEPQELFLGLKSVITGGVTQLMVADQPAGVIEISERNTKVNAPSADVDITVPGEVVPEKAPAGQVVALVPAALPEEIKLAGLAVVPLYIIKPS